MLDALPSLDDFTFVVDAMFGFSFKPPVREPFDEIINTLNVKGIFVSCIDIPSGLFFPLFHNIFSKF